MVWYSHLFQNFPEMVVIKGFGIVNKAEIDVFLELSCFFHDPAEVRNRFKGLDLIECLMNYGLRFVTLYRRQGSRPHGKQMQKGKTMETVKTSMVIRGSRGGKERKI